MSPKFKFDITAKKMRFSDNDLIESLKVYAKLKNYEYFSTTEYNKWDRKIVAAETFCNRFGSWNRVLRVIGIEGGHERRYTHEELVENLENIWKELNHPPAKRQLAKYGRRISEAPYRRFWGSLKSVCEQIALFHDGKINREQLLLKSKTNNKRRTIPLNVRWAVLKRDNYTCKKCGRSPGKDQTIELEIDHIMPVAKNGTNDIDNLETLCHECNQGKKDRI
jgi:5-methylcytosine-specific restriction endonuclease McrA